MELKITVAFHLFIILLLCFVNEIMSSLEYRSSIGESLLYGDFPFSKSSNEFGFHLGKEMSRTSDKNIVFAPFNIFTALAMLQLGSDGNTKDELTSVMRWAGTTEQLARMEILNGYLTRRSSRANITVASKMWIAEKIGISSKYRREIMSFFDTEIEQTLFGRDTENTRKRINRWIADETNDEIHALFPYESIARDTVFILANTIVFKGHWSKPFDPQFTREHAFSLYEGRDIEVPYMFQHDTFRHGTDNSRDVELVELPYERNVFSMIIATPKDSSAMNNIVNSLNQNLLNEWIGILNLGSKTQYHSKVDIFLPKFFLSQQLNLGNYLRIMGIRDLFTPGQADLSEMTEQRLHVSKIIHEAHVKADEEGTVASGATGSGISRTSVSEQIWINKPFFFFIIHKSRSNTVLFYGKVMNPIEDSR